MTDNNIQLLLKQAVIKHEADYKDWKKSTKKEKKQLLDPNSTWYNSQFQKDCVQWHKLERDLAYERWQESKRLLERYYSFVPKTKGKKK